MKKSVNEGEKKRERILSGLARRNKEWLRIVREEAHRVAQQNGEVTADMLREFITKLELKPTHIKAMGSIFRDKRFVPLRTQVSEHPVNHGKTVVVWGAA